MSARHLFTTGGPVYHRGACPPAHRPSLPPASPPPGLPARRGMMRATPRASRLALVPARGRAGPLTRGGIMVTRDSAWPAGTPCWIDLGVDDIGRASTFYTR